MGGRARVVDLRGGVRLPRLGRRAPAPSRPRQVAGDRRTCATRRTPTRPPREWRGAAAGLPPGAWVEGRGLGPESLAGTRLSGRAHARPRLAGPAGRGARVDGHALWVNSAALEAAGIDAATQDPEGGRILRRPDGSPSGILVDNAKALVGRVIPPPTAADLERWLTEARGRMRERRSDRGPGRLRLRRGRRSRRSRGSPRPERLPIRVYATVSPEPAALSACPREGPANRRGRRSSDRARDQGLRGRGAREPRRGAPRRTTPTSPGRRGLLVTSPERLAEIALEARRQRAGSSGSTPSAIAATASRSTPSRAAEKAVPEAPAGARRPRIEHAQVVAPEDFARFARLGVIASIQPTHATSDMAWAEERLGRRASRTPTPGAG